MPFTSTCIETWLLLNSAYPVCRSLIGFENSADNPLFSTCDLDHQWSSLSCPIGPSRSSPAGLAWTLSVRLGKFRSDNGVDSEIQAQNEVTSNMLGDAILWVLYNMLLVTPTFKWQWCCLVAVVLQLATRAKARFGSDNVEADEKKIGVRSRGDSFSVSKIWLWSKKGKFTTTSVANENIVVTDLV
ncbi:RING-H2 finger protein ATL46-like [Salvia splendens]|nr:RING-H2 finger protein ATL46-like [Salvia splendens]